MDDIDPSHYKGMELIFQGKHEEAEPLLLEALERAPENVELLCDLGLIYQNLEKWDVAEKRVELVGSLDELQANLDELIDGDASSVFTDLHTHSMEIRLGETVHMTRSECDSDPRASCSHGLHVGATSYVESFANSESVVLVCLVNPMNVVAVPNHDNSKIRVTEYFPFALANFEDRKIDIIEQSYFEYDYVNIEKGELEKILASEVEDAREVSYNAPADTRSDEDYLAILEARVTDLSVQK